MKHAIILLVAPVLSLALPQGAPAASQKLPFKEPGRFSIDCRFRGYTDELCGTKVYCESFDKVDDSIIGGHDGQFKSTKECFDAHDPEPTSQPDPDRIVFPDSQQDPDRIVFPDN